MSERDNQIMAKIAVERGFCTPAQIERCLQIQASTTEGLSLGQSLLREGFLSPDQYSEILQALRKRPGSGTNLVPLPAGAPKKSPVSRQDQEDDLLGKLAVREGLITQAQLNECLQGEKPGHPRRSLREILVARGLLEPARAEALLGRLSRRVLRCSACKTSFTVLSIANSKSVRCPRCRGTLEEVQEPGGAPPQDSCATGTVFKALSAALKTPPPPKKK